MCPAGDGSTGVPAAGGFGPSLDAEKPLDGHSVIGGSFNSNQLKTLQVELSDIIFTFGSINDTLKGLEHGVQKHGSVITDLGEPAAAAATPMHHRTGFTSPSDLLQETPRTRSSLSWTRFSRK